MEFKAHKYALDGGWDHDSFIATVKHGVADEDVSRLREMAAEAGLSGDDAEDFVAEAVEELEAMAQQRAGGVPHRSPAD